MCGENISSADNQQERSQSIGYYIAGFVDGEGSFNVSLRRKNDYKIGWQLVLSFNVSQKDPTVLYLIKEILGCGIIKQRKRDLLYSYDATNLKDIVTKVLPFFDRFKFISEYKKVNYSVFKEIVSLLMSKPMSTTIFYAVLELREKLNLGKGRKRKYTIDNVLVKSSETIRQAVSING